MKQLPFLLALGGFCIGLVITLSFLSGDDEGRVNLLYLLLLFVFIPVAGFILSLLSLVLPLGRGLAESVIEIPIWPKQWRRELPGMEMTGIRRAWFFYLSQLLALSLGLGCLIGFFVILLVNDVSFVWRSTVLAASDLLPLLRFLALPWTFWHEAQPSLTLLQLSQDFRLGEPNTNALVLGQWWKYALAAQLTYNLLPRGLMLITSRVIYHSRQVAVIKIEEPGPEQRIAKNRIPEEGTLAPVVTGVSGPYVLINWAAASDFPIDYVSRKFGAPEFIEKVAPETGRGDTQELVSRYRNATFVVLVKSWEPPMGELRDYLENLSTKGMILPLDWDTDHVNEIRDLHLGEWRRFSGTLDNWAVLIPGDNG